MAGFSEEVFLAAGFFAAAAGAFFLAAGFATVPASVFFAFEIGSVFSIAIAGVGGAGGAEASCLAASCQFG